MQTIDPHFEEAWTKLCARVLQASPGERVEVAAGEYAVTSTLVIPAGVRVCGEYEGELQATRWHARFVAASETTMVEVAGDGAAVEGIALRAGFAQQVIDRRQLFLQNGANYFCR